MNKKNLGRITALSIAALTAIPTFGIAASADLSLPSAPSTITVYNSTIYVVKDYNPNGTYVERYFNDITSATNACELDPNGVLVKPSSVSASTWLNNGDKFTVVGGEIIKSSNGTYVFSSSNSGSSNTTYYGYYYATDKVYYSASTNRYYPNRQAYYADSRNSGTTPTISDVKGVKYDSSHRYFNYMGGYYTNAESGTTEYMSGGYVGSGYYGQYVIPSGYQYASNTSYYSPETGTWYPNLEALRAAVGYATTNYSTKVPSSYSQAYSATNHYFNPEDGLYYSTSGGNRVSVTSGTSTTYYRYYSIITGKYYDTYNEALTASGGVTSYVKTISSNSNYYYDYNDPYYYYYYLLGGNAGGFTTTTKDTSKVTIGNLKGWTSVTRTINSAKAGASYTVNMKTETEIPESVLKALKGKNVTISFKFSNGAVFTLNGSDITSTNAISPVVRYGSTSIPSSLKKKAVKANDGVSSSQFTVNGSSFGASASLTVKFNSKRAGCGAKLYRYNSSDNTLSLVSRSAVQSNGQCEFDNVKQGGEYLVVLS